MAISIGFSTIPSIFTVQGRVFSFAAASATDFDDPNS
jgi:hypothetical protein